MRSNYKFWLQDSTVQNRKSVFMREWSIINTVIICFTFVRGLWCVSMFSSGASLLYKSVSCHGRHVICTLIKRLWSPLRLKNECRIFHFLFESRPMENAIGLSSTLGNQVFFCWIICFSIGWTKGHMMKKVTYALVRFFMMKRIKNPF